MCTVKMLVFPNQKQSKSQNPKQTISLEISVDAMSQNQRHSPGTIPALKGSLHLPFYKKTTEQNNLFNIFHRSNQKKAGSFQLQVINSNINKVFAQYPGFFTEKFP